MAFSNIGLQEPSTITKVVAAVTIARGSTTEYQEILCLGDPTSSNAIAAVSSAAPNTGDFGLTVRQVGYVAPSTQVSVSGYSTQVTVSGYVAPSTTVSIAHMVGNSSAADYMPVRIVDSSGTGYLAPGLEYTDGSTTSTLAAPGLAYSNGSNTTMRLVGTTQPLPVQLRSGINTFLSHSTVVNSSVASVVYPIISSVTSQRNCVFGYSVTSTAATPLTVKFTSSNSSGIWALDVGSGSSGISGANLTVPHPSRLFQSAPGETVGVILTSTGVNVRISVAYFTE